MQQPPQLISFDPDAHPGPEGVTLIVFAPFGEDTTLATYPDGSTQDVMQHPLTQALREVAATGVNVCALVDRVDDETWLIDIPAFQPEALACSSHWKQRMDSPRTLAGLVRHAHQRHPATSLVLALEGHGAGFIPEIDRNQLSAQAYTEDGRFQWQVTGSQASPVLPMGSPVLPMGSPVLPMGSPVLPMGTLPLSTWGLGEALRLAREAGAPRLAAIHFDNCFNMAVEVLHTVAPYAEVATGYMNYNFFTAGAPYPQVFRQLASQGSATPGQLGQWFADANHAVLAAKGNHPTTAGVVLLSRMQHIAECVDELADALLSVLSGAADRQAVVESIRRAIVRAQQYDSDGSMRLETPDELTDLASLAQALLRQDFPGDRVHAAAHALRESLAGIKRYGDDDSPWTDPSARWNFSERALAMNIFLPDPLLVGLWDWRSPYYLDVNPDSSRPGVQPQVIEFLKATDWVDFIVEYHREARFAGLLSPRRRPFPVFNARYQRPADAAGATAPAEDA
ncbi:clostripain-related cysteine peptidase [Rubrivivax gelatinosus]|uniref:clostripain-related cysteine peptidase n=1 Tax=Rubrivivax gelatinosus TaxID=28068 RepID=UPI003A80CD5A